MDPWIQIDLEFHSFYAYNKKQDDTIESAGVQTLNLHFGTVK